MSARRDQSHPHIAVPDVLATIAAPPHFDSRGFAVSRTCALSRTRVRKPMTDHTWRFDSRRWLDVDQVTSPRHVDSGRSLVRLARLRRAHVERLVLPEPVRLDDVAIRAVQHHSGRRCSRVALGGLRGARELGAQLRVPASEMRMEPFAIRTTHLALRANSRRTRAIPPAWDVARAHDIAGTRMRGQLDAILVAQINVPALLDRQRGLGGDFRAPVPTFPPQDDLGVARGVFQPKVVGTCLAPVATFFLRIISTLTLGERGWLAGRRTTRRSFGISRVDHTGRRHRLTRNGTSMIMLVAFGYTPARRSVGRHGVLHVCRCGKACSNPHT